MQNKTFAAAARQISLSCLISMLYVIIILLNGKPSLLFPAVLIAYSVVIFGVNRLFAKKTRTLAQLIVLNVICGAAVFALFLFSGIFSVAWQGFYGFFSLLILTVLGAVAVYSPVKLNSILLSMDANILLLLFSVLLIASLPHSFGWVAFSVLGAIAGLLGALSWRMGKPLGKREWGVLLFLFLIIAVIAWLLFAFVVSPLSTGVAGVGQVLAAFFVFLGSQIQRFFTFLASLMPDDDGTVDVNLQAASASSGQEEAGGSGDNSIIPLLIIGVIILVIIVVVVLFIRKNRKAKIAGRKLASVAGAEEIRQTPFKDALQKVLNRIRRKINAKRYLSANKSRPEGIYFTLKKICKRTPFAEQTGDTPAQFLRRIQAAFPSDSEACGQLETLSFQLDRNFYSRRPDAVSYPWARELVSSVRKLSGYKNR